MGLEDFSWKSHASRKYVTSYIWVGSRCVNILIDEKQNFVHNLKWFSRIILLIYSNVKLMKYSEIIASLVQILKNFIFNMNIWKTWNNQSRVNKMRVISYLCIHTFLPSEKMQRFQCLWAITFCSRIFWKLHLYFFKSCKVQLLLHNILQK